MGKLISYDPKHQYYNYSNHESKNLHVMHGKIKKAVKVTYISSPLFVRARDASEFRSLVQQLTGKDSNRDQPTNSSSRVMQRGGAILASATIVAAEDEKASSYCYNRSLDSLEFDEEYFWSEAARCIPLPSNVFA